MSSILTEMNGGIQIYYFYISINTLYNINQVILVDLLAC